MDSPLTKKQESSTEKRKDSFQRLQMKRDIEVRMGKEHQALADRGQALYPKQRQTDSCE